MMMQNKSPHPMPQEEGQSEQQFLPHVHRNNMHSSPPQQQPPQEAKCFWKVLLAVLLTAVVSITFTLGGSYLFFSQQAAARQTKSDLGIVATNGAEVPTSGSEAAGETKAPSSQEADTATVGLTFEQTPENTAELEKLAKIWELLQDFYYQDYTDAEMIALMSEGLVKNMGSRYTFYLSPEEREHDKEGMSGEYSGIGAIVQMNEEGNYVITRLVDDAPAMEAGLLPGDVFVAIDDKPVKDFKGVESLASAVRGEEGTPVKIEIYRETTDENLTFDVVRKHITTANLSYKMLDNKVGYIYVTEFSGHVADNFEKALRDLLQQGMTGLVIDFRYNGGGLADECIKMLDYLLDEATVSVIKGRMNGEPLEETWDTKDGMLVPKELPIALILNEYSASASELFSGALQDLGRAVIVGVQSFGKGVGTRTWDLDDGSAVQITNFEYYLPKGENIQDKGITPDYIVELPEEARNKQISQLTPQEDTQLLKAIELVKTK